MRASLAALRWARASDARFQNGFVSNGLQYLQGMLGDLRGMQEYMKPALKHAKSASKIEVQVVEIRV